MKEEQLETECFNHIFNNLDIILSNIDKNNLNQETIYQILKLETYNYLLDNNYIYTTESFKDIIDTFKSHFWSNTVNAWTGRVSMSNWITGVGLKTVSSGGFKASNLASSGLSEFFKKYLPVGFSTLALRIAFVSIFPTVLIGLTTYSLIRHKDIIKIKNFENYLKSSIESIQLHNKKDFKPIYKSINSEYNNILKNRCSKISNDKDKLKCASSQYIKYITEIPLKQLVEEYVKYLKNQKFDISYMTTVQELFTFKFNKNSIINKRFNELYKSYIDCLNIYDFENKKSKYINFLNREVIKNVKQ